MTWSRDLSLDGGRSTFGGSTGRSQSRTLRGGCTDEEALHLNGRSLLALSSGIAHGFGCVLFPEGTSHSQSFMLRFKTGPVRTVLAAAALAKANDLPLPQLVPVGLHFRRREKFRTDQYIEFGDPINLTDDMIPKPWSTPCETAAG